MSYNNNIPSPPAGEGKIDEPLLIKKAAEGENDAYKTLSDKYAPLINGMAARYGKKTGGASHDDLVQEAHIAFLGAIRSYDTDNGKVTFGLYAKICIRNKLVSLLRKSSKKWFDGEFGSVSIPAASGEKDRAGRLADIGEASLSKYERAALGSYLEGKSYKEIAKTLGKSEKSVDNALLRVRNKLRSAAKKKSPPTQKGDDN